MKSLRILFVTLIACILSFSSLVVMAQNDANDQSMSTPSTSSDDMGKMSDMMDKMKSMKMQMMGSRMMMMGMHMKMMGEMMSKSSDENTSDQGKSLMQLSEKVFDMGSKMNPNATPTMLMGGMKKRCMCNMMQMNQENQ